MFSSNRNVAVLGSAYGDEGKGRVIHYLSKDHRYVCRFGGSNNCGHTIYVDGQKVVYNQVPSVDFREPHVHGFLGSGMVINLWALKEELQRLEQLFPKAASKITVDPDAFVVLPRHIEEDKTKNGHIGSTNKGVGPAYVDKMSRSGTRVRDFLKDNSEITQELSRMGVKFKYVLEMYDEFKLSKILFEGSQGALIDLNIGTYPYVSCGDATAAGIYSSGFGFIAPTKVYGVGKVYSTKVGAGPFPTEYFDEEAETLRKMGNEYGAVTGRPRRVGSLDLPALRYARKRAGLTHLILTKFDILNGLDRIKVCNHYNKEPVCGDDFFDAVAEYTMASGWKDASDPDQTRNFIEFVEEQVGLRIEYISYGTGDADIVKL